MELSFKTDVFSKIKNHRGKRFIYGTGDGADKLLDYLFSIGVSVDGICVSDTFYRERVFRNMKVMPLSHYIDNYPDALFMMAFGVKNTDDIFSLYKKINLVYPEMPVCGTSPFTLETFNKDIDDILYTESFLEDEMSKIVLRNIIRFRLSGDIKFLMDCQTSEDEGYSLITDKNRKEILMDCGAYTGDTIEKFSCFINGFTDLYAAEPCPKSYSKLKSKYGEFHLYNCAIGKESGETFFLSSRGRGSVISTQAANTGKLLRIPIRTVDDILSGNECTILKFDIEGFEEDGFMGSFDTISKYHPSMLVAAYHKKDDIYKIPLLIKRYFPKYKIYLRHHPCLPSWETNVYAVYSH